jgi:hypothetical protein
MLCYLQYLQDVSIFLEKVKRKYQSSSDFIKNLEHIFRISFIYYGFFYYFRGFNGVSNPTHRCVRFNHFYQPCAENPLTQTLFDVLFTYYYLIIVIMLLDHIIQLFHTNNKSNL